uniref:Sulfotransfer_1 domain-containing protein n=1 Tax=Macrostomum lignano TaxID=282301 RepID=A0A1I8H456_9PLAT
LVDFAIHDGRCSPASNGDVATLQLRVGLGIVLQLLLLLGRGLHVELLEQLEALDDEEVSIFVALGDHGSDRGRQRHADPHAGQAERVGQVSGQVGQVQQHAVRHDAGHDAVEEPQQQVGHLGAFHLPEGAEALLVAGVGRQFFAFSEENAARNVDEKVNDAKNDEGVSPGVQFDQGRSKDVVRMLLVEVLVDHQADCAEDQRAADAVEDCVRQEQPVRVRHECTSDAGEQDGQGAQHLEELEAPAAAQDNGGAQRCGHVAYGGVGVANPVELGEGDRPVELGVQLGNKDAECASLAAEKDDVGGCAAQDQPGPELPSPVLLGWAAIAGVARAAAFSLAEYCAMLQQKQSESTHFFLMLESSVSVSVSGLWSRSLVSGLWSLFSGLWSLVSGLWSLVSVSGLWSLCLCLWSLVSGLWSLVFGLWSLISGLWSLVSVSGLWSLSLSLVSGLWSLVSGLWSLVSVSGLWSLVSDLWSLQTEEMQKTTEDSKTDAVDTKAAPVEMSQLNPKYPKMMNEFVYKDVLFVHWTTRRNIELVEQEFEFLPDDLLIATFPKSGTTLMQELAWLLRHNLDFAGAKASRVFERVPFLEENWTSHTCPRCRGRALSRRTCPTTSSGARIEAAPGPGFKTICVLRNPKDVLVSYYHFYKGVVDYGPWPWDFSSFFDMWMDGWIVAGDWFRVAKAWWAQRNRPDLLLVKFEDLVRRPALEIPRVAEFLGVEVGQDDVKRLANALSFDAMKENPATNYSGVPGMLDSFSFMRSGKVGDWKRFFTVSQSEQFDRIYQAEMAGTGLELEFDWTMNLARWAAAAAAAVVAVAAEAAAVGVSRGQQTLDEAEASHAAAAVCGGGQRQTWRHLPGCRRSWAPLLHHADGGVGLVRPAADCVDFAAQQRCAEVAPLLAAVSVVAAQGVELAVADALTETPERTLCIAHIGDHLPAVGSRAVSLCCVQAAPAVVPAYSVDEAVQLRRAHVVPLMVHVGPRLPALPAQIERFNAGRRALIAGGAVLHVAADNVDPVAEQHTAGVGVAATQHRAGRLAVPGPGSLLVVEYLGSGSPPHTKITSCGTRASFASDDNDEDAPASSSAARLRPQRSSSGDRLNSAACAGVRRPCRTQRSRAAGVSLSSSAP